MSKPQRSSNVSLPAELLEELLTPSEVRMLKNRWRIIQLLKKGFSVRAIAAQLKVGTDTVVRTARMMENRKLDEGKKQSQKTKTPWIFGKSDE